VGANSPDPFISSVIKNFDVEVAILSGNIQEINDTIIGCLVIKISGTDKAISDSIEYFNKGHVLTEVICHGN
jgi:D-methionine transport system ATP-binding protein